MTLQTYREYHFADTLARYVTDPSTQQIGLWLIPAAKAQAVVPHRISCMGDGTDPAKPAAIHVDPLVHVKLLGDAYSGTFAAGRTMRGSPSNARFKLHEQREQRSDDGCCIVTELRSSEGLRIEHRLTWTQGDGALCSQTRFFNDAKEPVTLEMLTSFALSGITPFDPADAPNRLRVHRFRSAWSAEGRLETRTIEQLHLERSWLGVGLYSERFGQVGSMPVRGWFPFAAVEDVVAGVTWAVQLAWPGSWQLEIGRQHDDVSLSGGLADREFGHWLCKLSPGQSLLTPQATMCCVAGDLDAACDRLTAMHQRSADAQPRVEHDLPILFNEWCTTWGDPTHEKVTAIAERLRDLPVKYLVIDAGWYRRKGESWASEHGDWQANAGQFPQGLAATAAAIRQRGLIPGLWFEMETVGKSSDAYTEQVDHLLHCDGLPLMVNGRRFWNLNDPAAVQYLSERVIGTLRDGGFGYLKVDYNETIELGCDGCESLGEGMRRQAEGIHCFFERIRRELPDLVIENCSSGGHRLEPSMLTRTAMSSFSDAHELPEIPIIAANLHRLVLPRQSQIWAVLKKADSIRRLTYSLAATFLGRMCLSGEITGLSDEQWRIVRQACALYRQCVPVIKHGVSRRYGQIGESWRHPTGWQCLTRLAADGGSWMAVAHSFGGSPTQAAVGLPPGRWAMAQSLEGTDIHATLKGGELVLKNLSDFSGTVVRCERV